MVPLGLVAIVVALIFIARGGSSGDGGLNPMAEAAQKTAKISGAKYAAELSESVEGGSGSITGSGTGSYNSQSHRADLTMKMTIPGHGSVAVESLGNSRVDYTRSSILSEQLPSGVEWVGMEPLLGQNLETAFGSGASPQTSMQMMETVGNVENLGGQTVGGEPTTRYKGTVEMAKLAQVLDEKGEAQLAKMYEKVVEKGLKEVEFETWVDSRGLARQIRTVEQMPATGGHTLTIDMRMRFYDFGTKPKIKFPASHLVLDYTPVIRTELGMDDGQSLGPFKPPAGAKPLTPSAFGDRAIAICHQVNGELSQLTHSHGALHRELNRLSSGSFALAEDKSVFEAYGRQLAEPTYEIYRRGIEKLGRLQPPAGDAADFQRYLHSSVKSLEVMLAEARGWQLGVLKVPGVEEAKAEIKAEEGQGNRHGKKLGLGACEQTGKSTTTSGA